MDMHGHACRLWGEDGGRDTHLMSRGSVTGRVDPAVVHEVDHGWEGRFTVGLVKSRAVSLGDGRVDLTGGGQTLKRPLSSQQLK